MGIEDLAADLLNEEPEKKEPKTPGSIEDEILEGIQTVDGEVQQLKERADESKDANLGNRGEFREELSAAKRELKEWGKLLKLATEKRKPTVAEAAALNGARLDALSRAAEAAQSVGVKNLEEVEAALSETDSAMRSNGLPESGEMRHEFQGREAEIREKQRLLTEARLWLKKATIIQSLMGINAEGSPTRSEVSQKKKGGEGPRRIIGLNEIIKIPATEGEREVRVVKLGDKVIVECSKFGDAVVVLKKIEREGLPALGISKESGLIDVKTERIDQRKVEVRFFIEESGSVRKSISINRYLEE